MKRRRLIAGWILLSGFVLVAATRPDGLGQVEEIRLFDHETHTRVVIELSREAQYEIHELSNPPRFYIDIEDTWIEAPNREPLAGTKDSPVRTVRGGQNMLKRARVVMELDGRDAGHRVFHLQKPFRIVADVFNGKPAPKQVKSYGGEDFDSRPVRRIVIDPGHGGKDPGAIGSGRVQEKKVVLEISKELRKQLERAGFEVFMTREKDVFISLEKRTAIANKLHADVFLSIHANASPDKRTHGVETYLLDTRYDRQTARVAARENGTTVGQLSELQKILASLRLGYNERFAARLAQSVQTSLLGSLGKKFRGTRNLGVKRGPFLVLFQANMPAVLVEVGFVSNRNEARNLKTPGFARAAARGIAGGIVGYREHHARSVVAER
ncbi:MAG: N-acetylmuramoyl-L-alanine amidase [bacterium]|nr:N-acetylmuramoyl-L-alanine amidase [bacterium]